MSGQITNTVELKGLKKSEIPGLRQQFGRNFFHVEKPRRLLHIIKAVVLEPMFILLLIAAILYVVLDQVAEGMMVIAAMIFVTGIAIFQDLRSSRALNALKELTAPTVMVIRNGIEYSIPADDLVPGDLIKLEEGNIIPADARIVQDNDLTVNESIITGESFPALKQQSAGSDLIYQGTTVNSGKCYAIVTATGSNTVLGKLGKSLSSYLPAKTLLQENVNIYVSRLALFGITAFVLISLVNYLKSGLLIESILFGLTLAMAAIPEEIPVAFSSFMALGAWQMSRLGIISRQPQTIENLGSVNVICLDKTGTITENKMRLVTVFNFELDALTGVESPDSTSVLGFAMLASEQNPFDAMEKAIHEAYRKYSKDHQFDHLRQVYEYPLQGTSPMMTHVYHYNGVRVAAAKGAPERILGVCKLDDPTIKKVTQYINSRAARGYRVIGVASAIHVSEEFPSSQEDFTWKFEGFICLYDPPKSNVQKTIRSFYEAKIDIKLLTGDYPETAINIAGQVGIRNASKFVTGDSIMKMDEHQLSETIKRVNVFARMFPEAKLRVINSLKSTGQVVAMTGDGVNDALALQSADIGIAMGKKGTEMAKQVADLVVTDDDLEKLIEAVRHGRKIFQNLKKAVRYIISIHVPIILTASLPVLLGWKYPHIFSPIHIIFLELIMGPTCSVFFEREPVEENVMTEAPRNRKVGLFESRDLLLSITQGLVITAGVLGTYYFLMHRGRSLEEIRTVVFTTLVMANIFLTFSNRSFTENITKTIHYKNELVAWVLGISLVFLLSIHFISSLRDIFGMVPMSFQMVLISSVIAFTSVAWFEIYKTYVQWIKRNSISSMVDKDHIPG